MNWRLFYRSLLGIVVISSLAVTASALSLVHQPLDELARNADRIVYVRVVSAQAVEATVGSMGTVPAMEYELEIVEAYKGDLQAGQTHTLRQVGSPYEKKGKKEGDSPVLSYAEMLSMPTYRVGENYMLFLRSESEVSGLASPIGLYQGAFQEVKAEDGKGTAFVNGANNLGLYKGMTGKDADGKRSVTFSRKAEEALASPGKPAEKEAFTTLVEEVVALQEAEAALAEEEEAGTETPAGQ